MNPLTSLTAAQLAGTSLSLADLLRREHRRGQLLPRLHLAATEAFLLDHARSLGLRVEDGELQQAANAFRRAQQTLSAEQTRDWLAQRRLSADDLEAALEEGLLMEKLKAHVAGPERVAQHFRERPDDYDRLRLRLILTEREDHARELLSQIQEEGADFAELAARHSRHPSAAQGGALPPLWRVQLAPPLREALVSAQVGTVVGPVATPEGFHLLRVEELTAAQLDSPTGAFIGQQLFEAWLNQQLDGAAFSAPLIDTLLSP